MSVESRTCEHVEALRDTTDAERDAFLRWWEGQANWTGSPCAVAYQGWLAGAASVVPELVAARAENAAVQARLRDEEERHALLQSRCYEGFASATDGIFDALRERDEENAALREALDSALSYHRCCAANLRAAQAAMDGADRLLSEVHRKGPSNG